MRRKLFALCLLMLVSLVSRSQALIGYTMSDVRKEHSNQEWNYGKWGDDKSLSMMSFTAEGISVAYYFNASGISVGTAIVPLSQGTLQGMIETYNKRYVIVDDTHWKFYTNGDVLKCTLSSTDDGMFFFYWYM